VVDRGREGDGLSRLIGVEYLELSAERARGRLEVTDDVRQPGGIVHGGAYAALAESICSRATYEAVRDEGMVAMGQANQASFLRPITTGAAHAVATARHRGRTTWIWDCEITDDDGRLCALVRMTIAVRPRPDG
jgi:1,4-dihydroxy-2-naphthoyl-CoA hydrolase